MGPFMHTSVFANGFLYNSFDIYSFRSSAQRWGSNHSMWDKMKDNKRQDEEKEELSGIPLQAQRQAAWQCRHSILSAPDRAKTIEQSKLTEPRLHPRWNEGSWGIRNRRQGGKIDCAFAEMRQGQSLANATKPQSYMRVNVSCMWVLLNRCWKWQASEMSCDIRTTDCGRRSSSLHKMPVLIYHLDQ